MKSFYKLALLLFAFTVFASATPEKWRLLNLLGGDSFISGLYVGNDSVEMGHPWDYSPILCDFLRKSIVDNHFLSGSSYYAFIETLIEELAFYEKPIVVLNNEPMNFASFCLDKLENAKVDGRVLFPFGYITGLGGGHALLLEVKRIEEDSYKFRIYNTGEGSQRHFKASSGDMFLPFVSSVPVSLNEIRKQGFFESMPRLYLLESDKAPSLSPMDAYGMVFNRFPYDQSEDEKYDSSFYIEGQKANTCSVSSLKVFFRSNLPNEVYNVLMNHATLLLLKDLTEDLLYVPPVLQKLWSRILQSLAANIILKPIGQEQNLSQILDAHRKLNSSINRWHVKFTSGTPVIIEKKHISSKVNIALRSNPQVSTISTLNLVLQSFKEILEYGFSNCDWASIGHILFSPIINAKFDSIENWDAPYLKEGLYIAKEISLKWIKICQKYGSLKIIRQELIVSVGLGSLLKLSHAIASQLDNINIREEKLRVGSYKSLLSLEKPLIGQGSFLDLHEVCFDESNLFTRFIFGSHLDSSFFELDGIENNRFISGKYLETWLEHYESNKSFDSSKENNLKQILAREAANLIKSDLSDQYKKPKLDEVKIAILAAGSNNERSIVPRMLPESFCVLRDIWNLLVICDYGETRFMDETLDKMEKSNSINFENPMQDFHYTYQTVRSSDSSFHILKVIGSDNLFMFESRSETHYSKQMKIFNLGSKYRKSLTFPENVNFSAFYDLGHEAFVSFFTTYTKTLSLKIHSGSFFHFLFTGNCGNKSLEYSTLTEYLNRCPRNVDYLMRILNNEFEKAKLLSDSFVVSFSQSNSLEYSGFEMFCVASFNFVLFMNHVKENRKFIKWSDISDKKTDFEPILHVVKSKIDEIESQELNETLKMGLFLLYTIKLAIFSVLDESDIFLIATCQLKRSLYWREWNFPQPVNFVADLFYFKLSYAIDDWLKSDEGKGRLSKFFGCQSFNYAFPSIMCDGRIFSFLSPSAGDSSSRMSVSAYLPEFSASLNLFFAEKVMNSNSVMLYPSSSNTSCFYFDLDEQAFKFNDGMENWILCEDSKLTLNNLQKNMLASFYCESRKAYRLIFCSFVLEVADSTIFLLNDDLSRSNFTLSTDQYFIYSSIFLNSETNLCYYIFNGPVGDVYILVLLGGQKLFSKYFNGHFVTSKLTDRVALFDLFVKNRYFEEAFKFVEESKTIDELTAFESHSSLTTLDLDALRKSIRLRIDCMRMDLGLPVRLTHFKPTPDESISKQLMTSSSSVYDFDKLTELQELLVTHRHESVPFKARKSQAIDVFSAFFSYEKNVITFEREMHYSLNVHNLPLYIESTVLADCFLSFMNQIISSNYPKRAEANLRNTKTEMNCTSHLLFLIQFARAKQCNSEKLLEIYELFLGSYDGEKKTGNFDLFDQLFASCFSLLPSSIEANHNISLNLPTDEEFFNNFKSMNLQDEFEIEAPFRISENSFAPLRDLSQLEAEILSLANPTIIEYEIRKVAKFSEKVDLDALLPCFSRSSLKCYKNILPFHSNDQITLLNSLIFEYYLSKVRIQRQSRNEHLDCRYWHDLSKLPKDSIDRILPLLLLFEFKANLTLQKEQLDDIVTFFGSKENRFVHRIMSYGKTFVLGTFLVILNADQAHLSLLIVPQSLFPSESANFPDRTAKFFGIHGHALIFSRDESFFSRRRLLWILFKLHLCIIRKEYFITTVESLEAMNNKILEFSHELSTNDSLCEKEKKTILFKLDILAEIWLLIKLKAVATIDEADASLSPLTSLNFPVGKLTPVNVELVDVIAELFEKMVKSEMILQRLQLVSLYANSINELDYNECLNEIIDICLGILESRQIKIEKKIFLIKSNAGIEEMLRDHFDAEQLNLIISLNSVIHVHLLESFMKNVNEHYGFSMIKNVEINIARPFFSANTPNENSEFQEILVTIVKTFRTFLQSYMRPWFVANVVNDIKSKIMAEAEFNEIPEQKTDAFEESLRVFGRNILKLNVRDEKSLLELQRDLHLSHNPKALNYLLIAAKKELYKIKRSSYQISSNAQNVLSGLSSYVGYSGSFDNEEIVCNNAIIKTDNEIYDIIRRKLKLMKMQYFDWPAPNDRLGIEEILSTSSEIQALIDAGAIFKNQKNLQVSKMILDHQNSIGRDTTAVLFFDEKTNFLHFLKKGNIQGELRTTNMTNILSILECSKQNIFVFLDQRHCTGVDLALAPDAIGLVTVNEKLTERELFQASLRMRHLVKGDQSLLILAPKCLSSHFTHGIESVLSICSSNSALKKTRESSEAYRHQAFAIAQSQIMAEALMKRNFKLFMEHEKLFYQQLPLDEYDKLSIVAPMQIKDLQAIVGEQSLKSIKSLEEKFSTIQLSSFEGDLLQEQIRIAESEVVKENEIEVEILVLQNSNEATYSAYSYSWPSLLSEVVSKGADKGNNLLHSLNAILAKVPGFKDFPAPFDSNVFVTANFLYRKTDTSKRIKTTFTTISVGLFFMIFHNQDGEEFIVFLDAFDLMEIKRKSGKWNNFAVYDLNGHVLLGSKNANNVKVHEIAMLLMLFQSMRNNLPAVKDDFYSWNRNKDRKLLSCTLLSSGKLPSPLVRDFMKQVPSVQLCVLRIFYEFKRGNLIEAIKLLSQLNAEDFPKEAFTKLTKEFLKWHKADLESLLSLYLKRKK